MLMLDLFSGLGGASQAMRERGWKVVRVDIEPKFEPDIVADIAEFHWEGERPTLVWASPPCTEFSKAFMPWYDFHTPDLSLVEHAKRIIRETEPVYWVIENVKGAVRYLGTPAMIIEPFYFWGHFPPVPKVKHRHRKQKFTGEKPELRAKIPYEISLAFALSIEKQLSLFDLI